LTEVFSHETFLSPFTWRYGSAEMRHIWSEVNKRQTWRQVWVALAEAQATAGLVTLEQVLDLRRHVDQIDIDAAHAIEREIHHDLMAEVRVYASQCTVGGAIIHLGATSMDVEDNAELLRLDAAFLLLEKQLRQVLHDLITKVERWADHPCMAYTHLQPAEPTTIGYRFAGYLQDLWADYQALGQVRADLKGKGIRGAVGTAASYTQLLQGTALSAAQLNEAVMNNLGHAAFEIAGQTTPRKQDIAILNMLSGIAMSLYKFAFDLRVLQSPAIGEWAEPFGKHQVGSSAMPFKRNPINAEKMDSLGRLVASLPQVAWDNAAHSLLERTLDDSANRREVLPLAFLAVDEMLITAHKLLDGLRIDENAVARNLAKYGTFAATERVLMEAVKRGADRQELHEVLREASMKAWATIADGSPNPLIDLLCQEQAITQFLDVPTIRDLMNAADYVGDAPQRARKLAATIRETLPDFQKTTEKITGS
jgi:adenylosuccinate lyase